MLPKTPVQPPSASVTAPTEGLPGTRLYKRMFHPCKLTTHDDNANALKEKENRCRMRIVK